MPIDPKTVHLSAERTAPAKSYAAITPHDSNNFSLAPCRAIYVGGDGNLVAVSQVGDSVTFVGLKAGSVLPIEAVRVNATNTTATNLVALY
jgi:hypothetical protein